MEIINRIGASQDLENLIFKKCHEKGDYILEGNIHEAILLRDVAKAKHLMGLGLMEQVEKEEAKLRKVGSIFNNSRLNYQSPYSGSWGSGSLGALIHCIVETSTLLHISGEVKKSKS